MILVLLAVLIMWAADHIVMRFRLDQTRIIARRAQARATEWEGIAKQEQTRAAEWEGAASLMATQAAEWQTTASTLASATAAVLKVVNEEYSPNGTHSSQTEEACDRS